MIAINKNLRGVVICAGVPLVIFAAAVICGRTSAFGVDGGILFGLLFFFFLQPLSSLVCGIISARKRYPLWFAFPLFAGLIGAFTPSVATNSNASGWSMFFLYSFEDWFLFFLYSFVPGLVGLAVTVAVSAFRKRMRSR